MKKTACSLVRKLVELDIKHNRPDEALGFLQESFITSRYRKDEDGMACVRKVAAEFFPDVPFNQRPA